eukprot:jgi/Mesvir1/6868/Mv09037-RA.1
MSGDNGESSKILIYAKQDVVSDYLRVKLEKEARKNWDKFYRVHENRFFKDRHYLHREFPELLGDAPGRDPPGGQGAPSPPGHSSGAREAPAEGSGAAEVANADPTDASVDSGTGHPAAWHASSGAETAASDPPPTCPSAAPTTSPPTAPTTSPPHVPTTSPSTAPPTSSTTPSPAPGARVLLELGCGAGNTVFPLLEEAGAGRQLFVYAADFSSRAVELVRQHPLYDPARVHAFVADATTDDLSAVIPPSSVHAATLVFMLSAMSHEKMPAVIRNVRGVLRGGGKVYVRDYAEGDLAQERLHEKQSNGATQKISDNFYVRADGTCAYYFSEELLVSLFREQGFVCDEVHMVRKEVCNRRKDIKMQRLWIQGVFTLRP